MGSQIAKLKLYEEETSNKSLKLEKFKTISENTRYEIQLVSDKLRLKIFIREFNKYDIMSETLISYSGANIGKPSNDYYDILLKLNSVSFRDDYSGKKTLFKEYYSGEEISNELLCIRDRNLRGYRAVFHSIAAALLKGNQSRILFQCDNACSNKIRGCSREQKSIKYNGRI